MKKVAILRLLDQVNCRFEDVDPLTRRAMVKALKFFVPNAQFSPAYKLGRWDGSVSFAQANGETFINLLEYVLPLVIDAGYEIDVVDERTIDVQTIDFDLIDTNILSHLVWPKGHPYEGEAIILHDHQAECVNRFTRNIQSMQSIATSAGKTIITGVLSSLAEKHGRTITIVPSKSLVLQTEVDYRNMGLEVGVFYGDRKEIGRTHTISTWQSLASILNERGSGDITMDDITDGVSAVIVDECHSIKGHELSKLLNSALRHVPIRWALSGTIPKDDISRLTLESCIGKVVGEITVAELQAKGIISKLHINNIVTDDSGNKFTHYLQEKQYLTTNPKRLQYIASLITEKAKTGNTLVLVENIETGETLCDLIEGSVFLSGDSKTDERKEEFDSIQESNNRVLIATYGIASTGISIARIFNLFLIEPGKSFVRVIQSIGRGIRKAKDKDFVDVYDISSNLKYSANHNKKRREFYKDAEYPQKTRNVKYKA